MEETAHPQGQTDTAKGGDLSYQIKTEAEDSAPPEGRAGPAPVVDDCTPRPPRARDFPGWVGGGGGCISVSCTAIPCTATPCIAAPPCTVVFCPPDDYYEDETPAAAPAAPAAPVAPAALKVVFSPSGMPPSAASASMPLAAASSSAAPPIAPGVAPNDEYYGYYEDEPPPAVTPIGAAPLPIAAAPTSNGVAASAPIAAGAAAPPALADDDCAPLAPSCVRALEAPHLPKRAARTRTSRTIPTSILNACPGSGRRVRVLRGGSAGSEEKPTLSISRTPQDAQLGVTKLTKPVSRRANYSRRTVVRSLTRPN